MILLKRDVYPSIAIHHRSVPLFLYISRKRYISTSLVTLVSILGYYQRSNFILRKISLLCPIIQYSTPLYKFVHNSLVLYFTQEQSAQSRVMQFPYMMLISYGTEDPQVEHADKGVDLSDERRSLDVQLLTQIRSTVECFSLVIVQRSFREYL